MALGVQDLLRGRLSASFRSLSDGESCLNKAINPNRPLNSLTDIARMLGLRSNADTDLIVRHFERQTNYAASIEIEELPVIEHSDETWEVRISRALPHAKIALRKGSRGTWVSSSEALPDDVKAFFKVRDLRGEMVTTRSWKAWMRTNWAKSGGRQLRSKQGEIQALVHIERVARETGSTMTALRVDPLLDEDTSQSEIRIQLPCPARTFLEVLEACKTSGMGVAA